MKKIFGLVDFDKNYKFLKESQEEFYSATETNIGVSLCGTIDNKREILEKFDIYDEIDDQTFIKIAYKKFGKKLFSMLNGLFALALYSPKEKKIYLVKDKIGAIPLYLYFDKKTLIFGTDLKEFSSLSHFSKEIDKDALIIYLKYGYILHSHTIFKNTIKVKPGHYISFDLKKREYFQREYWSLESCYIQDKILDSEDTIEKKIHSIITNSISRNLDQNRDIALSISGGYDSTTVGAFLTKVFGKKIDTFTIGFRDSSIDEAPYAKKIAKELGANHHEYYFSSLDAVKFIPKLSEIYDEPFADYGATPTLLINELIKDSGFSELYNGDGGDEIFATADNVKDFEKIMNLPKFIKYPPYKILNLLKIETIPLLNRYQNFPTKYYKFLEILKAEKISQMVEAKNILFNNYEIQKLINLDIFSTKSTFDEIEFPKNAQAVDQVIGSYFKTSMVSGELVKSFGAARAYNLNLKTPFLSVELIEYMARVPQSIKIKDGKKKYLLKKIAHRYIPKKLLDRPKSGFNIPLSYWLKEPLKELVFDQLNEKRVKDDSIFDSRYIVKIRDEFYSGNDAYRYKLWTIFIFQLWYQRVVKMERIDG